MDQSTSLAKSLADEITVEDDETLELSQFDQLVQEYHCQTPSELNLANIASINYIHYLNIQRQIADCESHLGALYYAHDRRCQPSDGFRPYNSNNGCRRSQFELLRFGVLSKEADRVYQRYLNALNMIIRMKQLPLQINIKTQTAIFGQNQVVQNNNE